MSPRVHVRYRLLLLMLLFCFFLLTVTQSDAEEKTAASLELTLPPTMYAVPGSEISLYFDNVILSEKDNGYQFKVDCAVGKNEAIRWTVTPKPEDVGEHKITLTVSDSEGNQIATGSTKLKVAPRNAGQGQVVRLLIIGDSLTHASAYPNELHRLLNLPENPKLEMLGTHKPKNANEGVAHEGYGGWTWHSFLKRHVDPSKSDGTYRTKSSPFIFKEEGQAPKLDIHRYFDESCGGVPPNVIVIKLGINDCFSANPEKPDEKIDAVFNYANELLTELQKVAPNALIGICLTTPGNGRDAAFETNYKGRYPRWGWKRIQHRLVQRQLEQFGNRDAEKISLIPTELNLDIHAGYPDNNSVHPNGVGYKQIGTTVYAWLKAQLAARRVVQ